MLMFSAVMAVQAQRTTSLKLNEILVINESNFVDDYGKRNSWIEIYNSSAGTVNIGGCFLTNDMSKPRMYAIPRGDVLTKIPPRQHTLFWADSNPSHGTFHLNFSLEKEGSNFIALFDSDGRTLIDSVTVPAGQRADISYGLVRDGWDKAKLNDESDSSLYDGGSNLWVYYDKVTPSSNNFILDANPKIDNFKEKDANGLGMTLTAMSVVFSGLLVLFLCFKLIGRIAVNMSRKRMMKAAGITKEEAKGLTSTESGAIYAAISMAIYEATEAHDVENTILTIKQTARNYSPWSSKIYTLRETPVLKKR